MFGKNYEFGSMDQEVTEEVEQRENKPEQLNIHTELAIQIHELYYKRLLSKKEVENVLSFLQEKSHGKDNYNTLELLHLMKENDYVLADKIVNLAKGIDESLLDEDNTTFENEMEKREREDNEFYGTNTEQFIQKLEKDGFEKSVIEEWIKKGKEF
ncbi:MAG: hypothetical protein U9Q12_02775, partial [Patescibacteria group bacterium]|nr:hypothetical protein [Patescibacteria group bacterium]